MIAGSVSILMRSGRNATLAGGARDARDTPDGGYAYGKLGWRSEIAKLGETSLSVDLYLGSDTAPGIDGAHAVGFEVRQAIDGRAVEIFSGVWRYWSDGEADPEDATVVLGGFRVRF